MSDRGRGKVLQGKPWKTTKGKTMENPMFIMVLIMETINVHHTFLTGAKRREFSGMIHNH